jgi:hypothetical protein
VFPDDWGAFLVVATIQCVRKNEATQVVGYFQDQGNQKKKLTCVDALEFGFGEK